MILKNDSETLTRRSYEDDEERSTFESAKSTPDAARDLAANMPDRSRRVNRIRRPARNKRNSSWSKFSHMCISDRTMSDLGRKSNCGEF